MVINSAFLNKLWGSRPFTMGLTGTATVNQMVIMAIVNPESHLERPKILLKNVWEYNVLHIKFPGNFQETHCSAVDLECNPRRAGEQNWLFMTTLMQLA